ncbi:hypothetical protein LIA77_04740 [Sarocladium implicatum]|nr:hypothetical protein LIA77_04740 [Sarocladium implicatum]
MADKKGGLPRHYHRRAERKVSLPSPDDSSDQRVPSGIVGTRIQQLTAADNIGPSQGVVVNTSQRERASTTLGWGRRLDRSFAKPASRNIIMLEEARLHLAEHNFMGPVTERKNHQQEHGLTRSSVQKSSRHRHRPLRQVASTTELLDQTPWHTHIRPGEDHQPATLAEFGPRTGDLGNPSSPFLSAVASSDARSVDTAARQQDALDMFEHYGVSRPEAYRKPQLCQECGKLLMGQRFCGNCGHEACEKCLEDNNSHNPPLHARSYSQKPSARPEASLARRYKKHKDHADGDEDNHHQHVSRSRETGNSTPRPRLPYASPSTAAKAEASKLESRPSIKTGFEGSGLVQGNPFFRKDRHTKGELPRPQTTTQNVHAHASMRNSEYVPGRRLGAPSPSSNGRQLFDPSCKEVHSRQPLLKHHKTCDANFGVQDKHRAKDEGIDTIGNHMQHSRHPAQPASLGGKIDRLNHHAQDLQHSQHILEHLAAATRADDTARKAAEPSTTRPGLFSKRGSLAGLRVHSLGEDEKIEALGLPNLHEVNADIETQVYRPPLHRSVEGIAVISTGLKPVTHDISADAVGPVQPPKVHDLSQDVLSKVEGWQRFHSNMPGSSRVGRSSGRLRPKSPRPWVDSPVKEQLPPALYQEQKTAKDEKSDAENILSTGQLKHDHSFQHTDGREIRQHHQVAESEPGCKPWPCVGDAEMSKERKASSVEQIHRRDQDRIPGSSHSVHRDTTSSDLTQWRQMLTGVDYAMLQPAKEKQVPEPAFRSTPRPTETSQRRTTCIYCAVASSSSSSREERRPCPVIEDKETDHHVVSLTHRRDLQHSQVSSTNVLPRRMSDLQRVEEALSRRAFDVNDTRTRKAFGAPRTLSTIRQTSPPRGSSADLYQPHPISSTDHTCSWRTRYIDLSSEMALMRAELRPWRSEASGAQETHNCPEAGIEGLTIVMHMKGKDDLVINTDLTREGSVCSHA